MLARPMRLDLPRKVAWGKKNEITPRVLRAWGGMHVCRFAGDWQLIREAPSRAPRFWSRKRRSVNRHFFISQFSYRRAGKNLFNECVALEDHLLPYSGRPEILKDLACSSRKIVPSRHGSDKLHESETTHELWFARRQMKGQSRSPVLCHDVGRRYSCFGKERIKITDMVGKAIGDLRLTGLSEPDEIRRDTVRYRRNRGNHVSPDIR